MPKSRILRRRSLNDEAYAWENAKKQVFGAGHSVTDAVCAGEKGNVCAGREKIMKIYGLQKMTLLDYPGRIACTVFLGGCDFRCPYCHNSELAEGKAEPVMEEEELFAFLGTRSGLLDGVTVSGGEPCLHAGLPQFLGRIRGMGFAVKLDTNGNHPEMLRRILQEGLADYVAMDIKNSPRHYARTAGLDILEPAGVRESVRMLLEGSTDYEFRTTVVDELFCRQDFVEIGEWIRGAGKYFLQPFEDRDSVPFAGLHAPDRAKLLEYADTVRPYVGEVQIRGM